MNYRDLPKIELHCHLDGSLDLNTSLELLKAQGRDYTLEKLKSEIPVTPDCTSLAEYLEKFDLPISIMQTREELERSAYGLAKNAAAENVKYIEVRFAPAFHKAKGLSYREIIEAVEAGLARARVETGIYTGIIVCAMRHMSMEENKEMYRAAREQLGSGVVACDLAGNEAAFPAADFKELFAEAKRLDFPYTIHAGECGSAVNVRDSVEMGAHRIGHGIASIKDPEVVKLLVNKGVGIEVCPTSNFQTKAFDISGAYPLRALLDAGVIANLSTDNRTVSGIDLTHEYELAASRLDLNMADFEQIYKNSVNVAFAADDIKNSLLRR